MLSIISFLQFISSFTFVKKKENVNNTSTFSPGLLKDQFHSNINMGLGIFSQFYHLLGSPSIEAKGGIMVVALVVVMFVVELPVSHKSSFSYRSVACVLGGLASHHYV